MMIRTKIQRYRPITAILLLGFVGTLSACGADLNDSPTPDPSDDPMHLGKADSPANGGAPGWTAGGTRANLKNLNDYGGGFFTANVLSDGRILVLGDRKVGAFYDVKSKQFSAIASSTIARSYFTATVMEDGRVFVVGGKISNKGIKDVEIYDPQTNTWSAAPPLAKGRFFHSATRLNDGRILIVGGQHADSYYTVPSVEIYDPQSNSWSLKADVKSARQQHTATILSDGSVLFVGGYNQMIKGGVRDVERYDPQTDSWQKIEELEFPRWDHAAVPLSGDRVFVVGGSSNYFKFNAVTEIVDVHAQSIQGLPPTGIARGRTTAHLIGSDKIAVMGIGDKNDLSTDETFPVEIFSLTDNAWYQSDALSFAVRAHQSVATPSDGIIAFMNDYGAPANVPSFHAMHYGLSIKKPVTQLPLVTVDYWIPRGKANPAITVRPNSVVFDENVNAIVNFPGRAEENVPIGMYAWKQDEWQEIVGSTQTPVPPRTNHLMAFDRARKKLVLFGGEKRHEYLLNDVWEFDGTSWTKITPADGFSPPAMWRGQLVYDSVRHEMLLLPGSDGLKQVKEMYVWNGSVWKLKDQGAYAPWQDQLDYEAAFDEKRGVLVVYRQGGYFTATSETWEFDGAKWTGASSGELGDRHGTAMAYDAVRGGIVLYGGDLHLPTNSSMTQNDTWFYNGTWKQLHPVGDPGSRAGHLLVYDPVQKRMVLDGVSWPVGNGNRFELYAIATPNRAPKMGYVKPQYTLYANQPFELPLGISDEDGHAVTISVEGMPTGSTFTVDQNALRITPTESDAGIYPITISASDGARTTVRITTLKIEGLFNYTGFPQGSIHHQSEVTVSGSLRRDGNMYWSPATFKVRCRFNGTNPGLVYVSCDIQDTSWPWSYRHIGTGVVAGDNTFVTQGGIWGKVRPLQWNDYEMVITNVRSHPYTNMEVMFSGESSAYLNALP